MAVLVVALFKPTMPRWIDRLNVVFLLDMSDSISLASRENAYRFAAQSVAAMPPGDQVGLIVFGEEAVVDQPLRAPPASSTARRRRSEAGARTWRRRSSSRSPARPPARPIASCS